MSLPALKNEPYNFPTFRRPMMKEDTYFHGGAKPGERAPAIDLPTIEGGRFRLNAADSKNDAPGNRKPMLLEFVSITCPMVLGGRPGLFALHKEFGDRVGFVSVYVREAHPGENYAHHETDAQKMQYARDWVAQDGIAWTVVVDDLAGTIHRAYGRVPNPAYLIDGDGTVVFRALGTAQAGLLRRKILELLRRVECSPAAYRQPINLGQRDNVFVPLLRGGVGFRQAVGRGGVKSLQDFRREMGLAIFFVANVLSMFRPRSRKGNKAS